MIRKMFKGKVITNYRTYFQEIFFALPIAFIAGVLSFLSPCVLPLVPSYVSFITGLSLDELGEKRWTAFTHALFFIAGFTIASIVA